MKSVLAIMLLTAVFASACGGGGGGAEEQRQSLPAAERSPYDFVMPVNTPLTSLTPAMIAEIKADISAINNAFFACEKELTEATKHLNLTNDQLRAVFAMVVANAMAPYGASDVEDLPDGLFKVPMLDCNEYAVLEGYLAEALDVPMKGWRAAGFMYGAIANHAQTFIAVDGREFLLDPTTGLVVVTSLDDLLDGIPVEAGKMAWIYAHADPDIRWSAGKYVRAMQWGLYRPEDLTALYPLRQ